MAHKTLIFFALNLIYLTSASDTNDLCPCDPKDEAELWKFLQKLSIDVPKEEEDIYAVSPGELSPIFDCDCGEYSRKRRSIVTPVESTEDSYWKLLREKVFHRRDGCPQGHVKFGSICIVEEFLNYDD